MTASGGLSLAGAHHAIAERIPDRPALIWRGQTWTWAETADRVARWAGLLAAHGIGRRLAGEPDRPWVSPHDHVALVLHNSNHYLEAMFGAARARAAAVNINWRYTAPEMTEVLDDASARAVIFHRSLATTVEAAVAAMAEPPALLVQVDDGAGAGSAAGALDAETALASTLPHTPAEGWSGDDRYILYTGGTTGRPKGVLWRQADFLATCLGISAPLPELVSTAARDRGLRALPAPPFMHGAAHWNAISAWLGGGTVVIQDTTDGFDPADVLDVCARERVSSLLVVGDAFARPLVAELTRQPRILRLRHLLTGGTVLSAPVKAQILELLPDVRIVDVLGSSETGRQAVTSSDRASGASSGSFTPEASAAVVDETRQRMLPPDDGALGWLAQRGRVPLGYLGDPDKTAATFPVIDGERVAVAGDRARWGDDGRVVLLGREAVCINTGGEKVFAEEVEQALAHHPGVADCLVVGRPDERLGQEVVAVVAVRPGHEIDLEGLRAVAADHLAGYKLPRGLVVVGTCQRSPSGKPDYAWARETAIAASG